MREAERLARLLNPHQRVDARQQLARGDRPRNVFVRANVEAGDLVFRRRFLAGDQHHEHIGQRGIGLDALAGFQAAQVRHHHIHQHQIEGLLAQQLQTARTARALGDREAFAAQQAHEQFEVRGIVVHHEDSGGLVHGSLVHLAPRLLVCNSLAGTLPPHRFSWLCGTRR